MKKLTIKVLIENSNIPATLIRSAINQFGGWESFKQLAPDVTNHGIDGGFHGFIYYADTTKFARRNMKNIIAMGEEQARDINETGFLGMVASFGCFRGDNLTQDEIARAIYQGKGEMVDQILNGLAWYAGGEVARLYCGLLEQEV